MRSRIRRPRDLWRAPKGHSSKILGGYHSDRPSDRIYRSNRGPWKLFRSYKVCSDAKDRVGYGKLLHLFIPSKNLGFWVCNGRPSFGQNCILGSCICSERPALGQNNLMMMTTTLKSERNIVFLFQWIFCLYSALYYTVARSAEGRPPGRPHYPGFSASVHVRPLLAQVRVCSLWLNCDCFCYNATKWVYFSSPDLTVCDFYLWGNLKNKVYQNNPHTLEELKDNIKREITAIPDEELMPVNRNFLQRCELCMAAQGHHFQHLLWQRYVIVVILNLHDKRRRLNLNFQCGNYLPLAGERRQERWCGEARTVRPAGRATFGWAGDSEI